MNAAGRRTALLLLPLLTFALPTPAAGRADAGVVLLEVEGWGHDWPGPRGTGKLPPTHPLGGFHLAEEMWDFLRRQVAPAPAAPGRPRGRGGGEG